MEDAFQNAVQEKYSVTQVRDKDTRQLLREVYRNAAGEVDRDGLPSVIDYNRESGDIEEVMYHRNGKLHREDGPAHYHIDPKTKIVTLEFWEQNGQLHRTGGLPSIIRRDSEAGEIHTRCFHINGEKVAPEIKGFTANRLVRD